MSETSSVRKRPARKIIGIRPKTGEPEALEIQPDADVESARLETHGNPTDDPPSDNAGQKLQRAFLFAFGGGLLGAVAGYLPGLSWLGFAVPLMAITGFFIWGYRQQFSERSDTRQRFADSCYFLGFLLTMMAMLVGFFPAGMLQQDITSQDILRHFSMALGATALGLVFRIIALQGGRSIGEVASEVEVSLISYSNKVSHEARLIGDELENARMALQAQRAEVSELVTVELREAVQSAFEPITQSASAISAILQSQTEQIVASANQLQEALSKSAAQLSDVAEVRTTANEAAHSAIASVAQALQRFEDQLDALRKGLVDAATSSTDEISKMTRALEQGTSVAPAVGPALERVQNSLSGLSETFEGLQVQSDAIATRLADAINDDGRALEALEETQSRLIGSLDAAGQAASDAIANEGELTRIAIEGTRSAFVESIEGERERATQQIRSHADQFSSDITRATDRLAEILASFAQRIEDAGRTR